MIRGLRKPNLSLTGVEKLVREYERIMGCLDCVRIPMTYAQIFLGIDTLHVSEFGYPALRSLINGEYVQFTPGRSIDEPGEYSLTEKGKSTFSKS